MLILSCNAGSTSLKFKLYDMPAERMLAEARIERVGSTDDAIFRYGNPQKNITVRKEGQNIPDYTAGIKMFLSALLDGEQGAISRIEEVQSVCFKTVLAKGFYNVHILSDEVMAGLDEYMDLAPTHNGPYIKCINEFKALLPGVTMVGVFETAFHQSIPVERTLYGIPYAWAEQYGIRRMGYHGASHGYIANRMSALYGKKHRVISCHLGGSGSLCAILDRKSVNTSFGISLHTGIMHAARVGDVDTSIVPFLLGRGLSLDEITKGLTKQGGLLGISGVSEDLRYVEEAATQGNERAALAIDVYCAHIIHYIGAFYASLGGLDCLAFAGGIGENSDIVRGKVCAALAHMGVALDAEKAAGKKADEQDISAAASAVRVWVIPTNEEVQIARQTWEFLQGK